MCKYKCGMTPTSREKQVIERAMRKVNRDVSRASVQMSSSANAPTPDGFYVVDMEQGTVRDAALAKQSPDKRKMSTVDSVLTVVFRFPIYVIFIVFIALHDILFDTIFRHRVRSAISFKPLDDEE